MKLFKHLPVLLFSFLFMLGTINTAQSKGTFKSSISQGEKGKKKKKEKSKSDKKGSRTRSYTPPKKDK